MGLRQEAGVDKVLPVEAGGEGLGVELVLGVGGQVGEQHLCGGISGEEWSATYLLCTRVVHRRYQDSTCLPGGLSASSVVQHIAVHTAHGGNRRDQMEENVHCSCF